MNDFNRASGLVMDTQPLTGSQLANMSREERREAVDRFEYEAAKARHEQKQAEIAAKVEAGVEVSMRGNQQIIAQQNGVNTGQALTAGQQAAAQEASGATFIPAPKALIDQLPVTIGGIQLGPKQAQEMLARGEIRPEDYKVALNKALAPYGAAFR